MHTRVKTDFHLEEPIEVFASRHGLSPGITDHAELLLCRNVLFAQPMRLLAALLDLLSTRMLSHANLFTRFPPYMKVCRCTIVALVLSLRCSPQLLSSGEYYPPPYGDKISV